MEHVELTEEEFLAAYDASRWPHPAVTADIALFRNFGGALQLLLIQRGNHPYKGSWALPGGFFEPGETIEACAARELEEETGITGVVLEPVGFYSAPKRDPRDWVTTRSFMAVVDASVQATAGDDAAEACWFQVSHAQEQARHTLTLQAGSTELVTSFTINELPITKTRQACIESHTGFAFDHYQIIADAWLALQQYITTVQPAP